jgi:uncharacterized protein (TIGR02145 family)
LQTKIKLTVSSFTCGQTLTDSRDGKNYNTVMIGTQCWFSQNLNIGTRVDGIVIQLNNSVIEKYCYNNDTSICYIYGGLYLWDEMMNYTTSSNSNPSGRQGICPIGWHIPSDAEWCQMEIYLDATVNCTVIGWRGTDIGIKLKEAGTSHWLNNVGATNSSGFTTLPGGRRGPSGIFTALGNSTYFSSTTENISTNTWTRYMDGYNLNDYRNSNVKTAGHSVRCLMD